MIERFLIIKIIRKKISLDLWQCAKRKDKRSDIALETKPTRFGIIPEFVLLRTDYFDLIENLFSWTK